MAQYREDLTSWLQDASEATADLLSDILAGRVDEAEISERLKHFLQALCMDVVSEIAGIRDDLAERLGETAADPNNEFRHLQHELL
jgi:hypothetical protein